MPPAIAGASVAPGAMAGDSNGRELLRLSDLRFGKKAQIDDYCQTVADEILIERSDFTRDRVPGQEFGTHLYTSMPAQNLRDLGYALGSLTRPKNQQWFNFKAREEWRNTERGKIWFTKARDKQRTLLYTQRAAFIPTMELSDKDVLAFGNSVVGHVEDEKRTGLLVYQPFHFRDCAWAEDATRHVNEMHRKFKVALSNYEMRFNCALPLQYSDIAKRDPGHEIEIRHIVMPYDQYDAYRPGGPKKGMPRLRFASVYLDVLRAAVVREGGYFEFPYTVRRWQLMDNTPYARSPAADLGLVEARLLQNQERVLMDAGELAVDPPTIATRDAVLGDVNNYPGGTSWVDFDYDERNGAAIKVLERNVQLPQGLEMKKDTREVLAAAMFISKLTLPMGNKDMTVPEINERISEYIRSIGPAVEPFELHNAMMLEASFSFNLRIGHFGPLQQVPPELRGSDIEFEFEGPIQIAVKRQKLMKARETAQTAGELSQIKPEVLDNYDFDAMSRDSAEYIGGEPNWLVAPEVVQMNRAQRAAQAAQEQQMQQMERMAPIAKGAVETVPALAQAGQIAQDAAGGASNLGPLSDDQGSMPTMGGMDGGPSLAEIMGNAPNPLDAEPTPSVDTTLQPPTNAPASAGAPTMRAPVGPPDGGQPPPAGQPDAHAAALQALLEHLSSPMQIKRDAAGKAVGFHRGK